MGDSVKKRKSNTVSMISSSSSPPASHPQPSSSKILKTFKENQAEMNSTFKPTLNPLDIPQVNHSNFFNPLIHLGNNPLDIPEIVEIVVGNIVKVADLKIIRTLNKLWRDESMKKWRNSAVFVITEKSKLVVVKAFDDSVVTDLGNEEQEKVLSEMDPFLLREIPFRNYRFQRDLAMTSDFERDLIFEKVIVPHAKYLDLGEWIISERERFDPLERIFCYNLSVTELALTPLWKDDDYFAEDGTFDREVHKWEQIYFNQPPKTAPTVLHLTLSAPSLWRKRKLLKKYGLKPLFVAGRGLSVYHEDYNYQSIVRCFILKKMPNLKGIHVSSDKAMHDILMEMNVSRRGVVVPQLEEIDIPLDKHHSGSLIGQLITYIRVVRPPLRKIRANFEWFDCNDGHCFLPVLRFVEETLTDLELELYCKDTRSAPPPSRNEEVFFLNGRHFHNLTRFKVVMDYQGGRGLLSFNLNHLRKMPNLREFFFGFKNPVKQIPESIILSKLKISEESPSWRNIWIEYLPETHGIPKGIYFDPVLGQKVEGDGLKYLRFFHFHGNLSKTALQLLGKWTKNLQALEGIFDEENFSTVRETWPRLDTLKLLQGSSVPEGLLVSQSTYELSVVRVDPGPSISSMRKGSLRKIVKKAV